MKKEEIQIIFNAIKKFIPKDLLPTVSEWAENSRFMTSKVSNLTGAFNFENTPYAKEIADCFSKHSNVREVAIMKGVQLGFTTAVFENTIGYTIAHDPSSMMLVSGDLKLLKEFKNIKIDNMIDNSNLRDKIIAETNNKHSRRTGDTAEMIDFFGGFLKIAGCHNANALRSLSIKKLFLDELDSYPKNINNEGSPIDLAVKRTESYSRTRKIGYISTPLLDYNSNIKELFEKGDQRKFFVPCPFCNKKQELIFYNSNEGEYNDEKAIEKDGIKTKPFGLLFDSESCKNGDYSTVVYRCKYCGNNIKDYHKKKMLINGEWKSTATSKKPYYRSYHLSALYSLFKPFEEIVCDFLNAGNDPNKLQAFYNLDLGLPFKEMSSAVEIYKIRRLKDENRNNGIIPDSALFLIGACDIQDDRLEIEIKAFGDRYRSWGIDHRIIKGNTSNPLDNCWKELYKIKNEVFNNGMIVNVILIDSGDGEKTELVYKFCEADDEKVFIPIKGITSTITTNKKFNYKKLNNYLNTKLLEIYVDKYKNQISNILNSEWRENENYPDGYMTFANNYTEEYFRQLTTEKKIKEKQSNGNIFIKWEQHGRNEAFDLCVYCLCGAEFVILDLMNSLNIVKTQDAFNYLTSTMDKKL